MTLIQVWGVLLIFVICPILGGVPLINWVFRAIRKRSLTALGTGNISVSAAFYHGGKWVGGLAVLSEAGKGIAAVLLARSFFPAGSVWEVIALIALVMGRYWMGRGAGTTNVGWGFVAHDAIAAGLIVLIGGIGFTILRERQLGKFSLLGLMPIVTALRHPDDGELIGATVTLSLLMGWIYQKIPDDLELSDQNVRSDSQSMFKFFRGDRALLSLDQPLQSEKVGQKAATLAFLKQQGYPVPMGWVLPPGDDPAPLIQTIQPSAEQPFVARSSAIGEDSDTASAAGQYESFLDITSQPALEQAILRCQASYNLPRAVQYRRDRLGQEAGMAVLVQVQVPGTFSGVAFSRDPVSRQGDAVVIEALPGSASRVVSGRITPEQYRVWSQGAATPAIQSTALTHGTGAVGSEEWEVEELSGKNGDVPQAVIRQVAALARQLEALYHGIPQDVEWTFDGQQVWILQSRPITTLLPIWTRKIAAEVIPGFIRPLTWSINRPLTCGVWGEIFSVVLGTRAQGLDFAETATLHHATAYFNATLLGQTFLRMGLPPESLEFLTRGAAFSKPPIASTLRNLPGLLRLLQREIRLETDFKRDQTHHFSPGLAELASQAVGTLAPEALLSRIEQVLLLLRRATYYSILAPLSVAVRQGIFKPDPAALDNSRTPEVDSMRSLQSLATQARNILPDLDQSTSDRTRFFSTLTTTPEGQQILRQWDEFLAQYGYLSEVGTDIAVPTWAENPQPIQELFTQFVRQPPRTVASLQSVPASNASSRRVQRRLDLKGEVTAVYSRLLAELRWSMVALEQRWTQSGLLAAAGDIFFLEIEEIRQLVADSHLPLHLEVKEVVARRRSQFTQDQQQTAIPLLVYGNDPPQPLVDVRDRPIASGQMLRGIGASPGIVEGQVLVVRSLQSVTTLERNTILVVPYTDSGWSPLLVQAAGIIAEAGGRLSHGAIIAREYGIPAVMDVHNAMQQLRDGQRVRVNGQDGVVERMEDGG